MRKQSREFRAIVAETYKLFGVAAMIAALVTMMVILLTATINGIYGGNYSVLVVTNLFDEDFIELALMILAIPAIFAIVRRLVYQSPR